MVINFEQTITNKDYSRNCFVSETQINEIGKKICEINLNEKSIIKLIELCEHLNPKKLKLIEINDPDQLSGIKSTLNKMIEKISNHKKEVEEMQFENDLLTKEIRFQNQELSTQLTKNSIVERKKEEFLSMMTHEFMTPLTPIISWLDILLSGAFGEINDKQAGALEKIKKNSLKLLGLITDVLDVNKIDLNELTFNKSRINSKEITCDVIGTYEELMRKQKIKFVFSDIEDISLYSDKNRIDQILRIFITNAIDFVPDTGAEIEIKVKQEKDSVLFCIIDNGIGIKALNQQKLFNKFYQIDASVTRKHGGSGLGLSVAKGIIEGLGGEIGVTSIDCKGSKFFIKIPIDSKILSKNIDC